MKCYIIPLVIINWPRYWFLCLFGQTVFEMMRKPLCLSGNLFQADTQLYSRWVLWGRHLFRSWLRKELSCFKITQRANGLTHFFRIFLLRRLKYTKHIKRLKYNFSQFLATLLIRSHSYITSHKYCGFRIYRVGHDAQCFVYKLSPERTYT